MFKPGDKVRCIARFNGMWPQLNVIYTVREHIHHDRYGEYVVLQEIFDYYHGGSYDPKHFELVEPVVMEPSFFD